MAGCMGIWLDLQDNYCLWVTTFRAHGMDHPPKSTQPSHKSICQHDHKTSTQENKNLYHPRLSSLCRLSHNFSRASHCFCITCTFLGQFGSIWRIATEMTMSESENATRWSTLCLGHKRNPRSDSDVLSHDYKKNQPSFTFEFKVVPGRADGRSFRRETTLFESLHCKTQCNQYYPYELELTKTK